MAEPRDASSQGRGKTPRHQAEDDHQQEIHQRVNSQEQAADEFQVQCESYGEEEDGGGEADLEGIREGAAQILLVDLAVDSRHHSNAYQMATVRGTIPG